MITVYFFSAFFLLGENRRQLAGHRHDNLSLPDGDDTNFVYLLVKFDIFAFDVQTYSFA